MNRIAIALVSLLAGTGLASAEGTGGVVACTIAATPLVFGQYRSNASASADFTATLTVTCSTASAALLPVRGTLQLGGGAGGISARHLANGARILRYQLYTDSARTIVWGDTPGTLPTVLGTVSRNGKLRQTITVFGRIPAGQTGVPPGTYVDLIPALLSY